MERSRDSAAISRRAWIGLGLLGATGVGLSERWSVQEASADGTSDEGQLIVRSRRPLNLESTSSAFDHRITPAHSLFVRSHFGAPVVDLGTWEVEIVGLVRRTLKLRLEDLGRMERASKTAVIQCAGNGRGLFRPRVPGTPWERGAVGQAEWSGVRLADLLDRAGVQEGAAHLHFYGSDAPPSPKISAFVRSIPIDRARDPGTLLALGMNGEPLPLLHGGPARVVVPGWAGNNWTKWVRRIVVSREEAPSFYMQTAYRMPRTPVPADAPAGSVAMDPVTWMNVKSLIASPVQGGSVASGPVEVRGVAWTGRGHVTKVEVRIDDGPWKAAILRDVPEPGAWRRWSYRLESSRPGRHVVAARATDSEGEVQPETPPWNKSGYLWNGYDTVAFEVK